MLQWYKYIYIYRLRKFQNKDNCKYTDDQQAKIDCGIYCFGVFFNAVHCLM